jgi:hypothetical protein
MTKSMQSSSASSGGMSARAVTSPINDDDTAPLLPLMQERKEGRNKELRVWWQRQGK